jgi:outer membrane protein insertion porin family
VRANGCALGLVLGGLVAGLASGPAAQEAPLASGAGAEEAPQPMVAVLPFEVHSARPIDYLGDSLPDLLRARLETSGRVRVIDATDRAAPEARRGETLDTALRRTAQELAADYVVSGSLTELAGRFSLDVRLTPAVVGLQGHTQVLTAQREEDLLGRVNEIADRITAQIAGAAPAIVAKVEISGAVGYAEDLRARLKTKPGEPYDPLSVRDDLAGLRSNPAVVSAEAETRRGPEGVVVRFDVVLAGPALGSAALAEGDIVSEVVIRGNRRIEADAIRARIATRPGGPFVPAQIARDIQEIHALGFFRDIRVLTEEGVAGRIVIFEVEENPVVRQISISGNDNIESDKIRDVLTLTTGSTLDQPLLYENRQRIEALYRTDGYYLAEVGFEIEPLGEASVGIHFDIDEKEKLKLRDIEFTGNEAMDDSDLTDGFQTKVWHFWSYATSWFDRSGTYSEPIFIQDLQGVEKKYTDAGYLQVEIGEPEVIPSEDGLRVVVNVNEGRRFNVGTLEVTGDSTVDIDVLRGKLKLKEGDVFNRSALAEDISSLTEYYQDRGFYFAQVTPLSDLSEAAEAVDVTFDVRKGPLYFIRRIDISGNTITVDPVIRREIPIAEGQLYSQRAVMLARGRIERLGFFESVDFQMEPTDSPDQLDLKVSVVERPTGQFSFGAGYSSQDGFVLTGSLSQSNLFGRGYQAQAELQFGGETQRFFLNLTDPYFLGSEFSFSGLFSLTDLRFDSFDQQQIGAEVVLGHALNEENTSRGFLRYAFNSRAIRDDSRVNAASLIFRDFFQGRISSSLVGLTFVSDTRNDRFAPTSGHRYGLTIEGSGIGGFSRFARFEGRAFWWLGAPRWLLPRSSFVVGTRIGWTVPFNLISDYFIPPLGQFDNFILANNPQSGTLATIDSDLTLPLTERYYLGGIGNFQLRGFQARSVGPRRSILQQSVGGGTFTPVGRNFATGECEDDGTSGGNGNGVCNSIDDTRIDQFADLQETDVIGGNKFISSTLEYRFPISETVGLQGVVFFDTGNAFDETQLNLFDVTEWRYGTGAGIQWFSPFGPLALILGFPLDKLSVEKSPVFEFSVGGGAF